MRSVLPGMRAMHHGFTESSASVGCDSYNLMVGSSLKNVDDSEHNFDIC